MGKRIETILTVVGPHAAVADPSVWQIHVGNVQYGVVNAASTEWFFISDLAVFLLISRKEVE